MSEKQISFKLVFDSSGAVTGIKNAEGELSKFEKQTAKTKDEIKNTGKEAGGAFGAMSKGLKALGVDIGPLEGGLKKVKGGTDGLAGSSKALGGAMKAIPILAIVSAIAFLLKAFLSTQEGADKFNRVMEPIKQLFQILWGLVQDLSLALSKDLTKAFEDPLGSIQKLGKAILDNIIGRVMGMLKLIPRLGEAIGLVFKRDFEGAAKVAANAILQIGTGVEDSLALFEQIGEKAKSVFDGLQDKIDQAIASGGRLADLKVEIEELENSQILSLAKMKREYAEILRLGRDVTLSDEERITALQEAEKIAGEIKDEQARLLELKIEDAELRAAANDTDREAQKEINMLLAQRDELETEYQNKIRRTSAQISAIALKQQGEAEADAEARAEEQRQIMENFQARKEAFEELRRSDVENAQLAFDEQVESLQELLDNEIITQQEYYDSITAMRDRYFDGYNTAEEALASRKAKLREQEKRAFMEVQAQMLASAIESSIQRGDHAVTTTLKIIRAIIAELIAEQIANVIKTVPFPLNVALAPAAGMAAAAMAKGIIPTKFGKGGFVGGQRHSAGGTIIEAEQGEFVLSRTASQKFKNILPSMNNGELDNINMSSFVMGSGGNEDINVLIGALKNLRFELDNRVLYASVKEEINRRQDRYLGTDALP